MPARKSQTNSLILSHRRRVFPQQGRFILGAAIGTGMAAMAAERGGADFLLALSAGRLRSMGVPSPASLLALCDSNRLVMEFGQSEILARTSLPVFFGASAFAPDEDFTALVERIVEAGFQGVTNFPTCIFLDGRYRQFLEAKGFGLTRELTLLRQARKRGLSTLAYVHTVEEARLAASAGVGIVNLNFGWNMGGVAGVESPLDLEAATVLTGQFVDVVRAISPQTRCLIEGGPIVTPEQMEQVCSLAKADGYIGGSTIDRVPLETAIEMATGAFKTIGALRKQVDSLEKQLRRKIQADALIGLGEAMQLAREQVAQAMESDLPVLIVGPSGTGRREVARLIHEARVRRGRWMVVVECAQGSEQEVRLKLFGHSAGDSSEEKSQTSLLEQARGSTLLLDEVAALPISVQRQLLEAVRGGMFSAHSVDPRPSHGVRFIGITRFDPAQEPDAKRFDQNFVQWLSTLRIDLQPLRERLEDLPMLAESLLRALGHGGKRKLDPSAYRALLGHHWPDNLRELRAVLQKAAMKSRSAAITARDLPPLGQSPAFSSKNKASFASEREWILDALKRNRFRRAAAAQFLGIARKTLYNKMRQYGLNRQARPSRRNTLR